MKVQYASIIPVFTSVLAHRNLHPEHNPLPAFQKKSSRFGMPFTMNKLHILSLFLSGVLAIPAPQVADVVLPPPPNCRDIYTISNQHDLEGDLITGDYTVGGGKKPQVVLIPQSYLN